MEDFKTNQEKEIKNQYDLYYDLLIEYILKKSYIRYCIDLNKYLLYNCGYIKEEQKEPEWREIDYKKKINQWKKQIADKIINEELDLTNIIENLSFSTKIKIKPFDPYVENLRWQKIPKRSLKEKIEDVTNVLVNMKTKLSLLEAKNVVLYKMYMNIIPKKSIKF